MVDIQSTTAEIRRGKTKKERRRRKKQDKNIMSAFATQGGHKKLQRVMNAAARVISDTRKFDRSLKRFLHEDLHWLDVPQGVTYKLFFLLVFGLAPQYL